MRFGQACGSAARAIKKRCVIQRMGGQDVLKVRRPGGVKMQPRVIDKQAQRRTAGAAWVKRSEKRIFDSHQRDIVFLGHGRAAVRCASGPPHGDGVPRTGPAKVQRVSGVAQDPADPPLGEKAAVVYEKPLVLLWTSGGAVVEIGPESHAAYSPERVRRLAAELAVPVMAEITFDHWVNGASVT